MKLAPEYNEVPLSTVKGTSGKKTSGFPFNYISYCNANDSIQLQAFRNERKDF